MVIMQVANADEVHIVRHDDAIRYLAELARTTRIRRIYMHNTAFDTGVIGSPVLLDLLERDCVIEIAARMALHHTAGRGYVPKDLYFPTLDYLTAKYLKQTLPKDDAIRLTFTRDKPLSDAHLTYAALDPMVTFELARLIPEQPTEGLQTRAGVVLSAIGRNGMLVDRPAWDATIDRLTGRLHDLDDKLRGFGFESDTNANKPASMLARLVGEVGNGLVPPDETPSSVAMRGALHTLLTAPDGSYDSFRAYVAGSLFSPAESVRLVKKGTKPTADQAAFAALLDSLDMAELGTTAKRRPLIKVMLELLKIRRTEESSVEALQKLAQAYQANGGWLSDSAYMQPGAFLQQYLRGFEAANGIRLPRTDGTADETDPLKQQIKLSKEDSWMLAERNISDAFLDTYMDFKHCEKVLGTYLKSAYIKDDGRIHPRYNVIVSTGRTSCVGPNLQNPIREKGYRELFVAPPGHALVAIDYSQLELCTLSQHALALYGGSRMAEIINAGLDVHKWFGARRTGLLKPANDYRVEEPGSFERVQQILEGVTEEVRSDSKAGNFG